MNKDEMIKKMAIDLVDEIDYSTGIYGDSVEEYAVVYFDYDHTAKNMVEKGYCKVTDDEIVIKKSEYEALKKAKNIIQLDISEEFLKECEYEMRELEQKTKQETAREILQELKDRQTLMLADEVFGRETVVTQKINELAKEKGIELE